MPVFFCYEMVALGYRKTFFFFEDSKIRMSV